MFICVRLVLWFALTAILFSVVQGQTTQTPQTADIFHAFPAGSIQCATGDYIITGSGKAWTVYLVQDLYFMSRLVPIDNPEGGLSVVEQINVADSATPPKWREIQLLLTQYKRVIESREEAIAAIDSQQLGDSIQGLSRAVTEFKKETSFVYKKPTSPIPIRDYDNGDGRSFEQDKPRIDRFAKAMKTNSSARAYIIAYGGLVSYKNEARIRLRCIENYLKTAHGIPRSRLELIDGGHRTEVAVQLILVDPEDPKPTAYSPVNPEAVQIRKAPKRPCGR